MFGTTASVLIGNGDGTFQSKLDTASTSSLGVVLADVDADGRAD